MLKTATIRARLSPSLKEDVEKTLASLGLTVSDAIQLLFHQIQLRKGLPFDVAIPIPQRHASSAPARRAVA
jgi:DNA-damage-inducible protein J